MFFITREKRSGWIFKNIMIFVIFLQASLYSFAMGENVLEGAESVVLPCHYSGILPERNPTVIWRRYDLKPQTIHVRREDDDLRGQNQRFSGRTSMKSNALDSLDFSLTLRKPHFSDSGTYTCSLRDDREDITLTDVQLQVEASRESLTVKVEVYKGEQSVVLPCQYSQVLEEILTVKWSRYDLNPNTVHQQREGDDLHSQNQLFKGRTSMTPHSLDSGDFSLTLKKPQLSDSGIYICSITDDEGEKKLSDVQLHVKVLLPASKDALTVKVEVQWAQFVVLPCQYHQVLEEIVTVKWSRYDLNPNTVHQRREGDDLRGQNQIFNGRTSMRADALASGDFSLTLNEPPVSDSGNYTCTIINEEVEIKLSEVQLDVIAIPTWVRVLLVLLVLLVLTIFVSLFFKFRQYLMSEISTRARILLVLLVLLVLVFVSGALLFYFQHKFKTKIPTLALGVLFLLLFLTINVSNLFHFRQRYISKISFWTRILLIVRVFLVLLGPALSVGWFFNFIPGIYLTFLGIAVVVMAVLAICAEIVFHFKDYLLPEISTWIRMLLELLFMLVLLSFHASMFSGIQGYTKSEIFSTWYGIIMLLHIQVFLVSETGDLYFHFRDNLLSDMSDKVRIFLDLLAMLVLFSVYGGLLFHFRDNLMSEIPTWARIFLVLWILLVFSVHVGLLVFFRQNFMLVYRVEEDPGVESVLLPFKTSLRLPKEIQVTWTNNSDRIIHKAQGSSCGLLRLEEQDFQYADRTEMNKTFTLGDLSLILKNPTDRDTDSYTCTVSKKSGKILVKKKVLLNVKAGPDSLIIAIDFGSGFSGYAFNVKPREEGGETQIRRWSNGLGLDTPKTPTCILFDEHEEFMKFGYEAKTAFTNMREEEAEKYYFFENFNIVIQGKDTSKQTIKAANDKSMKVLKVFTEALRFLKDDALKTIRSHPEGGEFTASDFTWVLTVPELLDQSTKQFIIEAATQAGLVTDDTKDKLMFVLESEAALTWCLKLQSDGFITQNHSRDSQDQPAGAAEPDTSCNDPPESQEVVKFMTKPEETIVLLETQRDGKRYLVVSCGDYSHFTVHKVLEEGTRKLHKDRGRYLGGRSVDEKFKKFLREIFDEVWREYEKSFPNEVQKMMYDFTRLKHLGEDVQISCPGNLVMLAQKKKNKEIEKFFDSVEGASWDDGSIRISQEKLKSFYDESLQRITERLREILDKNLNIGYIVLVGGFAESQILRQHITDQFGPQYKVLCPLRPQQAILKGAVELGRNPKLVESQRKRPAWFKCLS
ncbi:uncharacterized protein LOC116723453 isoform X3 [Xiphophorus hellerii]|uniref:uncharacterized protein LOC116723453 isoform X3 n=1 Tax=Xiphophorus hellerii TaxID=8084 RepID=UPI0013B45FB9|nr:uncharacterized protein LOC116723453 isoform X3 [Xiphophorus hellerii]